MFTAELFRQPPRVAYRYFDMLTRLVVKPAESGMKNAKTT